MNDLYYVFAIRVMFLCATTEVAYIDSHHAQIETGPLSIPRLAFATLIRVELRRRKTNGCSSMKILMVQRRRMFRGTLYGE